MAVQEIFTPRAIGTDGTLNLTGLRALSGFTADISGTLTVGGTAVLTALPVTAGVYTPLPYGIPDTGDSSIVLSGGARGCAGVA